MLHISKSLRLPLLLWSVTTLFFAFQFILRLSTGLLMDDIMLKYNISTAAYGTLAGYYYLGYAGMQIPFGIMLDRYNFRYISVLAIWLAALGNFIFVMNVSWEIILLARFMVGCGSAIAFIAVAKVIKTFFPERYHDKMIGFSFTFGLLGAVFGTKPMKLLFNNYSNDTVLTALSVFAVIISLLILAVNDKKIEKQADLITDRSTLADAFKILINPKILLISLSGGLMVGSLDGFTDVWSFKLFNQIFGFSDTDSPQAVSFVFYGMCVGGPLLVLAANKLRSNYLVIFLTGILTITIFLLMFMWSNWSFYQIATLMFILGILCSYQVIVFNITCTLVDKSLAGVSIAVVNCINMAFGYAFHKVISSIIEQGWTGLTDPHGARLYNLETFISGLSPIPIGCAIGIIGFLYLAVSSRSKKERSPA